MSNDNFRKKIVVKIHFRAKRYTAFNMKIEASHQIYISKKI